MSMQYSMDQITPMVYLVMEDEIFTNNIDINQLTRQDATIYGPH